MKGKHHLLSGIIFLLLVLIIDLFTGLRISSLIQKTNSVIIVLSLYLFFTGILLPDSDKFGSWIFKFFFPFAITSWFLGLLVSSLKGKRFKHRGFLHSVLGITLTSFSSSLIVFLFITIFMNVNFYLFIIFFFSIFLGQSLHLVLD